MIKTTAFLMPKGHRPPPVGGKPGEEPAVAGWSREEWLSSESYAGVAANHALKTAYPDQRDPRIAAYWASLGIRRALFDADHDLDDRGNARYAFAVLSPLEWQPGKRYPLLYYSHPGGANNYDAEQMGFSRLIPQEQFIAVYPENGGFSNQDVLTEFPRILNHLERENYPIDWGRVYAAGFSAGSDATESLGTQYPDVLAAVAPCPGSNAMYNSLCRLYGDAYQKAARFTMPLCCVGGTADFGDVYPYPDPECYENFNIWAGEICRVPGYRPITFAQAQRLAAQSDDPAIRWTGLPFPRTWTRHMEGRPWYFGEFPGAGGEPLIRFVIGKDLPHEVTNCHVRLVWDWLKCWSRDPATGMLHYTLR